MASVGSVPVWGWRWNCAPGAWACVEPSASGGVAGVGAGTGAPALPGFGPALAAEKLAERHELVVSRETVRHWMMIAGLWLSRPQRLGESVQIDGSEHRWFEDRAGPCSLLVFIDDATSRLMDLRFVESESTFSYFAALSGYLGRHGRPLAFYSDKHTVFRAARSATAKGGQGMTQFGRALAELGIEVSYFEVRLSFIIRWLVLATAMGEHYSHLSLAEPCCAVPSSLRSAWSPSVRDCCGDQTLPKNHDDRPPRQTLRPATPTSRSDTAPALLHHAMGHDRPKSEMRIADQE